MANITQDMRYRQSLMQYAEKVWREPGEPEIQQGAVIYLLLACPLGRQRGAPGLQVPTAPQPSKPTYGSRTEADPRHVAQDPGAWIDGVVAPAGYCQKLCANKCCRLVSAGHPAETEVF